MHRRSFAAVLTAGLVLLALPAVATAVPGHRAHRAAPAPSPIQGARTIAPALADPLGLLVGTSIVKVHVYTPLGVPRVAAAVRWSVVTDSDSSSGAGVTDTDGFVQFTDVPGAPAYDGDITIDPAGKGPFYDIWNLSWPDGGTFDAGYQPGKLQMKLLAGGFFDKNFRSYPDAFFQTVSQNGDATQETDSSQTHPSAATLMQTEPQVLNGTVQGGAVQFWYDEGTELPTAVSGTTVAPGSTVDSGQVIHEATAQRMYNFTWASGKPGTRTTIKFQNFPNGWVNALSGVSESPTGRAAKGYGTWTMPGGTGWVSRSFTIPPGAKPGYTYDIIADHADSYLSIYEPFQVCSLIPSRAKVSAGASIRFSGRVPFNLNATSPRPKTVLLYRRATRAGQPASPGGHASVNGWTKIKSFKTGATGKYRSPLVRISRTGSYVLWYPGDNYNWSAWTSVVRVTATR